MSKQFSRGGAGGGGRRGGLGMSSNSIGIKKNSSHIGGYKPRRAGGGGPPAEEKQRQSVFDRLGTRRVNAVNASSHYQSGSGGGDGLGRAKKTNAPKSPERKVNISSSGRQVSDRGPRGRSRSRSRGSRSSRSPLPKHRVKPSTSSATTSRKVNVKSVVASSKKDRSHRKPSPSSRHHETSKVKVKSHKDGRSSPKHRLKTVVNTSKGKKFSSSSGQVQKGKRHGHGHTPSVSSDESSSQGGESSSTTSSMSSSSSVTDDSGSSSSEGSSDSDSSVPSVKIKHVKKGKDVLKKKVKSKIQEHSDEWEQSRKELTSKKIKIRTEVISIGSPHSKSHPTSGKRGSSEVRGNTRDRDFGDRRTTAVAKISRTDRDSHSRSRDLHHFARAGESKGSGLERHSQAIRPDRFEESNRKRRLSGENYDGSNKRNRIATPPPARLKNVGRRTRSPSPIGRVHDSHMIPSSNRERTPLSSMRDRPRVTSPLPKRPPFDDTRRGEIRRDIKQQRYVSPAPFMKSKESERDRDRPFSASFGSTFESPNYNRDERHRERFAPSRDTTQPQGPRERIVPPQHSDRRNTRDVESTSRRAPLLPFPSDVKPIYHYQNQSSGGGSQTPNEPYNKRGSAPSTFRKRSPLIVKTKEALIEKYEEIRQSRVDMWVDETLRGGPPKRSPTPTSTSKVFPDDLVGTSTFEKEKKRSTSIGSGNELDKSKEIEEEDLSDFSDDADDILKKEVAVPKGTVSEGTSRVKVDQDVTMTKDVYSESAKVSSSNLREDSVHPRYESIANVQVSANLTSTEARTVRSQSQSQTDDDLLERMDFEEISDEELGEGENKIGIVDALGVDWSSLVCREKTDKAASEGGGGVAKDSASAARKLKDKWSAANIFKQVGLSRQLAGDALFEKVFSKIQDLEERNGIVETTTMEELEYPDWRRKRLERKHLLDDIGIGPYSRALSSRRDLAVRRYLLNMIPKSLVSLDMLHQTPAPRSQLEVDYVRSIPAKCNT